VDENRWMKKEFWVGLCIACIDVGNEIFRLNTQRNSAYFRFRGAFVYLLVSVLFLIGLMLVLTWVHALI
jgi:hypothetical protein